MTPPNANKRGAGWRRRSEAAARAVARAKRIDEAQVTRSDEDLIAEAIATGVGAKLPPRAWAAPRWSV